MNIYGALLLTAKDYSFFSSIPGSLIKTYEPVVEQSEFQLSVV